MSEPTHGDVELVRSLRLSATAIYLAAPEAVARDASSVLIAAADRLEELSGMRPPAAGGRVPPSDPASERAS